MYQLALLFLTAVLAGFALIVVTSLAASFLSATVINILIGLGAIAVIVFALALLYLASKALFRELR